MMKKNITLDEYSSPELEVFVLGAEDSFLSVEPGAGEGFEQPIED